MSDSKLTHSFVRDIRTNHSQFMENENEDHARVSTDSGVNWDFIIPSDATTCSEQSNEMTELCSKLLCSFGEFLLPVGLTYQLRVYPKNQSLPYGDNTSKPTETYVRELSDECGLTADDFMTSTQIDHSGSRFIPRVPFHHNRLKVRLNNSDQYIDRTYCIAYKKGEPVNRDPTWDPLDLTISFAPNRYHDDIDSPYLFHISVSLRSDIWLAKTERGETNRAYLSAFLGRLSDTLPVEKVDREVYSASDMWNDLDIRSLVGSFDPEEVY